MYVERKAESLNGSARIGRVALSKTGRTVEYRGQKFQKSKSGYKWNYFDVETGDHYWISGPRKDGQDRCILKVPSPLRSMKTFAKNTGQRFVACLSAGRPEIKLTPPPPQQTLDGVVKVSDG